MPDSSEAGAEVSDFWPQPPHKIAARPAIPMMFVKRFMVVLVRFKWLAPRTPDPGGTVTNDPTGGMRCLGRRGGVFALSYGMSNRLSPMFDALVL